MADIAGTAVGVISLGITVCQGLVKYYDGFRSRRDDIESTFERIQSLRNILEVLQTRISVGAPNSSASFVQVEESICACEANLRVLSTTLTRFADASPQANFKQKFKARARQLTYSLQRSTIQELDQRVGRVQQNLQTALNVLQLKDEFDQIQALRNVSSVSTHTAHNVTAIRSTVEEMSNSLELRLSAMMEKRNNELYETFVHYPALFPSMMQGALAESDTSQGSNPMKALTEPKQNSSLSPITRLREAPFGGLCSCVTARRKVSTELLQYCSWKSLISICHTQDSTESHRPNCPFSRIAGKQKNTIKLRFACQRSLLSKIIQASISITRGAGGMSIAGALHCARLVPYDAPAFRLIRSLFSDFGQKGSERDTGPAVVSILQDATLKLTTMIRNGTFSPLDRIDSFLGASLLVQFMGVLTFGLRRSYSATSVPIPADAMPHLIAFIKWLLHCGVGLSGQDLPFVMDLIWPLFKESDHAVYDMLAIVFVEELPDASEMFESSIEQLSGYMEPSDLLSLQSTRLLSPSGDVYADLGISEFHRSILRRSIAQVQNCLSNDEACIFERSFCRLTSLHLCVGWPKGLEVLLNNGGFALLNEMAERANGNNPTPLDDATDKGYWETVVILIKAGGLWSKRYKAANALVATGHRVDIINALRTRYKIIRSNTHTLLSQGENTIETNNHLRPPKRTSRIPSVRVADSANAQKTRKILLAKESNMGWILTPRSYDLSLHHLLYDAGSRDFPGDELCHRQLDEAGFEGRDQEDKHGYTPLMRSFIAGGHTPFRDRACSYLLRSGADIHRQMRVPKEQGSLNIEFVNTTRAHWIAAELGHALLVYERLRGGKKDFWDNRLWALLPQWGITTLEDNDTYITTKVAEVQAHDDCICLCSTNGCSTVNKLLKNFLNKMGPSIEHWNGYGYNEYDTLKKFQLPSLAALLRVWTLIVHSNCDTELRLEKQFLRFLTFEHLGLKHTCCRLWRPPKGFTEESRWYSYLVRPPKNEITEIREEQRLFEFQFEELMAEFDLAYDLVDETFPEFLQRGYWAQRMEEVLQEPAHFSANEAQRLQEVGVVLDPDVRARVREIDDDEDLNGTSNEPDTEESEGSDSEDDDFHDAES